MQSSANPLFVTDDYEERIYFCASTLEDFETDASTTRRTRLQSTDLNPAAFFTVIGIITTNVIIICMYVCIITIVIIISFHYYYHIEAAVSSPAASYSYFMVFWSRYIPIIVISNREIK